MNNIKKEYIALFKSILQRANPKLEINHIFFDNENMVATDTRILLIHKHGEEVKIPFLAINPKVKVKDLAAEIEEHGPDYSLQHLKHIGDITIGKDIWKMRDESLVKFPEYNRIVPRSKEYRVESLTGNPFGLDILYKLTHDNGVMFDYVKFAPFMKNLNKIEFNSYTYRDKEHPVMLENDDLKVIIMPMVF